MRLGIVRWLAIVICGVAASPLGAFSVLTHEAIIDDSWDVGIRPLLVARFPGATAEQLREAHAYAYGGAIIQDMGYYPFGSHFFSDLVHYVRSGDFVAALIRESQDLDEYAFALGSAAHYAADNSGHPLAINRAVPMLYPKLRAKFGDRITYEDDPTAHLKTEFAFDVVQVARGQYAPQAYHDFIGFQVAEPLLGRAFQDTYSLELSQAFGNLNRSVGTFRFMVSSLIPEATKTAWAAKKKDILQLQAGMKRKKFVYRYSRATYRKDWGRKYDEPGFGARFLAVLFRIFPKVGPFKAFAFKVPTLDAERLFLTSFSDTQTHFRGLLTEQGQGGTRLPNENFDTGTPTKRGDYHMADETYDKLLEHLREKPEVISPALRADILRFYGPAQPMTDGARAVFQTLQSAH